MKKTFKCEYCGRLIKTEECPYCGGVNEIPIIPSSDEPTGKAADCIPPVPPRKPYKKNTSLFKKVITFFQIHTCLRDLVLAVLFVVIVLVISYIVWLASENKSKPSFETSDTVLTTDKDFSVPRCLTGE